MKEPTMKTLMTLCAAAVALAIPAGALAHDGHGRHSGWSNHHAALAKLTGTGSTFGSSTATASGSVAGVDVLSTGTFTANLSTNWSAATTKTSDRGTLVCAPATATLSVVGAVTTNTLSASLSGKTCAWTKTGGTTVRTFFGKGTAAGAGALASLNNASGKVFLSQKADGTVKGGAFTGKRSDARFSTFAVREHDASHQTGDCNK
jgi:hypothetical protein